MDALMPCTAQSAAGKANANSTSTSAPTPSNVVASKDTAASPVPFPLAQFDPQVGCETQRENRTEFNVFEGGHEIQSVFTTTRKYWAEDNGPTQTFRTTNTHIQRTFTEQITDDNSDTKVPAVGTASKNEESDTKVPAVGAAFKKESERAPKCKREEEAEAGPSDEGRRGHATRNVVLRLDTDVPTTAATTVVDGPMPKGVRDIHYYWKGKGKKRSSKKGESAAADYADGSSPLRAIVID